MTRKLDIESRLDRSLANQVKAPRLGRAFDAAVWARIEAEAQAATNPVSTQRKVLSAARWLQISNVIGVAVAAVLVVVFVVQSFAGVSLDVPKVEVSVATTKQIFAIAGPIITVVSLGFGLMYTRFGRWLRSEFA